MPLMILSTIQLLQSEGSKCPCIAMPCRRTDTAFTRAGSDLRSPRSLEKAQMAVSKQLQLHYPGLNVHSLPFYAATEPILRN